MVKWLEKHRLISFTIMILLAIEIFWFSSLQFIGGGKSLSIISIAYHFIVFFLFSFFLFATIKRNKKITALQIFIVLIISTTYAISDEIHQSFVPSRDAGIRDILTNTSGIFFSMLIYIYITKKSNSFLEKENDHRSSYEEEYERENEV